MASPLLLVLAASGLVASGVPASNNAPAARPAALVTPVANGKTGMCLIPTTKGRVLKLSDYRKALRGKTCANQFMQAGAAGAAGAGAGAAGGGISAGVIAGGVAVAATAATVGVVASQNDTPAP